MRLLWKSIPSPVSDCFRPLSDAYVPTPFTGSVYAPSVLNYWFENQFFAFKTDVLYRIKSNYVL